MCGIVGLIAGGGIADATATASLVATMRDRLAHRGPDDAGLWLDQSAGVVFGFRRLSIVDLSPAGAQPMHSADGRYVVVMNGEIYNFNDLRSTIDGLRGGHQWRGHSDTEVLVEAIATWGVEDAIRRTNGMFAVAVWDCRDRCLWLARDRIGEKPLYYGWAGDSFVFASELKALWPHPQFDRRLSEAAFRDFMQLGYVLGSRTIFAATSRLPGGHLLRLDPHDVAQRTTPASKTYWDLREVALTGLELQASGRVADEAELEALLRDAVTRRMVADVPVGVFLSGGIDSSLVAGIMVAVATEEVRSFSIGFNIPGWDEAQFARPIAAHLGTRHEELYLDKSDVIAAVQDLPQICDEPFADDSIIPTTLLCRMARRSVTVALSGDGGDELFSGYTRYAAAARLLERRDALPSPLRKLAAGLIDHGLRVSSGWGGHRLQRRARLLGRLLCSDSADTFNEALMSQSLDLDSLLAVPGNHRAPLSGGAYSLGRSGALDRMTFMDSVTYLVDDILTKVDRASMSTALEVRPPLLDHRVIEMSWRFPASAKQEGGAGKAPLRSILHRHVPRPLVDRPKQGFGAPVEAWLRHDLRDWAEALLTREALGRHGLLNVTACRQLWEGFAYRGRGWDKAIWSLLMFQAWYAAIATEVPADRRLAA